jgi:hypothetical protein
MARFSDAWRFGYLFQIRATRVAVQALARHSSLHRKNPPCAKQLKTNAIVLRHRQTNCCMVRPGSDRKEVTMSAVAEVLSTISHSPRGCDLPTCPVCADSMVAAEASAYLADNIVSYLWTCDTCGYGFVTRHSLKRLVCN